MNQADTVSFRLVGKEEIVSLLPILSVINPFLSEHVLKTQLGEMVEQGYRCAAAFEKERCVGVVGLWIQTRFYVGKHVEYDHLFILPAYRRRGIAAGLLRFVDAYALGQGCVAAELLCDIAEETSRRFWEKLGFETIGFRYQKRLRRNPSASKT